MTIRFLYDQRVKEKRERENNEYSKFARQESRSGRDFFD